MGGLAGGPAAKVDTHLRSMTNIATLTFDRAMLTEVEVGAIKFYVAN